MSVITVVFDGMAPMILKYNHDRRAKRSMQSIVFTCQKFIWQNYLEFAAKGEYEN